MAPERLRLSQQVARGSAELVLCVNGSGDVIGCAGVEGEITDIVRIKHISYLLHIFNRYCFVFFNK